MSTLKISQHSDVPAALDLVGEEVDKEARRINQAGGAAGCGKPQASVGGDCLRGEAERFRQEDSEARRRVAEA